MSDPNADLPEFMELVGFGVVLAGVIGLLPTSVGSPVAVFLGVVMFGLGRWYL